MRTFTVHPKSLGGEIQIPPSKSHSQRALLFAMKGQGISRIENLLDSPDIRAMRQAIEQLGASCREEGDMLEVTAGFSPSSEVIDAENSGQILRFLSALVALFPTYTEVTGDGSVCRRRPIKPLLGALRQLGALAESVRGDGYAPVRICGPIHPGICELDGQDSQPVSGLLIATSFLDGPSEIFVDEPGETPWIDLTLDWLKRLGATVTHQNYRHYLVKGGLSYSGFHYTVPGDYSSAAYPMAAALITESPLTLTGLSNEDVQGDRMVFEIAKKMGAKISWKKENLLIEPGKLKGIDIDVNHCIDALPILAVLGCYASGTTRLYNGAIARQKESNRIHSIAMELNKLGAQIVERPDGLIIEQSTLRGAVVNSHRDHRIALSLSVAAMGATGPTTIEGVEWIDKSYPSFARDMNAIGAEIELDLVRV